MARSEKIGHRLSLMILSNQSRVWYDVRGPDLWQCVWCQNFKGEVLISSNFFGSGQLPCLRWLILAERISSDLKTYRKNVFFEVSFYDFKGAVMLIFFSVIFNLFLYCFLQDHLPTCGLKFNGHKSITWIKIHGVGYC